MSIPQIDLNTTTSLADEINVALSSHGFFRATNPIINQTLLGQVFDAAREFFESADDIKQACTYGSASENFGYQKIATERLDQNSPPDVKETFTMRNVINRPPADDRWPSEAFAKLMSAFFNDTLQQALVLQRSLATALGTPDHFFTQYHTGENVTLRLLHYPPTQQALDAGQLGAGAHTDYGLLTLLMQDDVGGLEVLDPSDQWQAVPPVAGSVIVNSGDLLERWSNGRYRSALHRVQPTVGQKSRLSVVLFVDPDSATPVAALPSCVSSTNPAKFPPVTAGEHLLERIHASHS